MRGSALCVRSQRTADGEVVPDSIRQIVGVKSLQVTDGEKCAGKQKTR